MTQKRSCSSAPFASPIVESSSTSTDRNPSCFLLSRPHRIYGAVGSHGSGRGADDGGRRREHGANTGGYTQNGTFSEFCILSRHLDRFCSSKRPRGPRGPPELPNDKKTAAPRLLDRLLFRYPPPQIRLKWDVLSVTFNGKFQR